MAKLVYDKGGRLLFTKEMKKEYTLLLPMMLPYHFTLIKKLLDRKGFNTVLLSTTHQNIVDEGLQNVHNDTCYPALLVIGQLLDAIKSGQYDDKKIAVVISQTGGGCRASNYIHLLRKALHKSGYSHVPVVSFSIGGMEKNPGFKLSFPVLLKMGIGIIYADLIMDLANQTRPYETVKGSADALSLQLIDYIIAHPVKALQLKKMLKKIVSMFAALEAVKTEKVKVGVVGEIYVKFAPLGNNNLEEFLRGEDCEVVVPGLMDFILYCCESVIADGEILGLRKGKARIYKMIKNLLVGIQGKMISAIGKYSGFRAPSRFDDIKTMVANYLSTANKMGEGWLLTGEMLELIESGVQNIVCTQPFGCLPNHIVGKGMIREIRRNHESANIVAIDYDPGATRINQENRIKLMLSSARENLSGGGVNEN